MPKGLNSFFASKDKTDSIDATIEAVSRLFVETLRVLENKTFLNRDEIEDVFDRAATESSDDVENYLNAIYELLYPTDDDEVGDSDESDGNG